jgi:hypothetical protein
MSQPHPRPGPTKRQCYKKKVRLSKGTGKAEGPGVACYAVGGGPLHQSQIYWKLPFRLHTGNFVKFHFSYILESYIFSNRFQNFRHLMNLLKLRHYCLARNHPTAAASCRILCSSASLVLAPPVSTITTSSGIIVAAPFADSAAGAASVKVSTPPASDPAEKN